MQVQGDLLALADVNFKTTKHCKPAVVEEFLTGKSSLWRLYVSEKKTSNNTIGL